MMIYMFEVIIFSHLDYSGSGGKTFTDNGQSLVIKAPRSAIRAQVS